jgi:hypothetical protein
MNATVFKARGNMNMSDSLSINDNRRNLALIIRKTDEGVRKLMTDLDVNEDQWSYANKINKTIDIWKDEAMQSCKILDEKSRWIKKTNLVLRENCLKMIFLLTSIVDDLDGNLRFQESRTVVIQWLPIVTTFLTSLTTGEYIDLPAGPLTTKYQNDFNLLVKIDDIFNYFKDCYGLRQLESICYVSKKKWDGRINEFIDILKENQQNTSEKREWISILELLQPGTQIYNQDDFRGSVMYFHKKLFEKPILQAIARLEALMERLMPN